ncbi:MAG TPA: YeeE/YedE family protein [Dissulfurispiraceae bacterium]|nr:YeeE/YedE family protein [Dissulfurispiraceae bacterium]
MNSAFRDVIFVNDMTLLRAWLLALGVAIIGSNLIEDFGLLGEDGLARQVFAPIAAIVGGYIFGLGIVMAGGCGSGVLYKQGEGQFAAFIATVGFVFTLIMSYHGPLAPVMKWIKSYKISIGSGDDAIANPALWDLFSAPNLKWVFIAVIVVIIIPIVLKGGPFGKQPKKGWSWALGGLLVGLVIVLAWWTSYEWGGRARGLSFSGPLSELVTFSMLGDSMAKNDQLFSIFGYGAISWSALYIIGVPIGAFLSAKGLSEFKLTAPKQVDELLRVFFGGMIMGVGGALAGG